jgi:hypothetical protein
MLKRRSSGTVFVEVIGLLACILLLGCDEPHPRQSDTTETTIDDSPTVAAATPVPKIQAPIVETPILPEASEPKKTYLTKYVSKVTDDGVVGIPAGTEVTVKDRVGDKLVISDGVVVLQVEESFLTDDENISSDIRDRDLRARRIIEAKSAEDQKAAYRREMELYSSASTNSDASSASSIAKPAANMSAAELARIRQRISDLEMRIGTATQMQKLKRMAPNTYRGSYEGPEGLKRERDRLKRLLE